MRLQKSFLAALGICFFFFLLYSVLGIVKHNHFLSGYDLGIIDQVTWEYSRFLAPITTIYAYTFTNILTNHIEFIYVFLSPLFWFWQDSRILILAQAFVFCFSGVPIFLLAQKILPKKYLLLAFALLLSYLLFYGVQNALWDDVHSDVFGAAFLSWFIYFSTIKRLRLTIASYALAITAKEDVAFMAFFISAIFAIKEREKLQMALMAVSAIYLFVVFFIYFPYFTPGYQLQNPHGLFSGLSPFSYFDTAAKRTSLWYSFLSFGFLPFLSPLYFLPAFADFTHYFLFGNHLERVQEIFLHYRVTLAPLLIWPTITALKKITDFSFLKKRGVFINIFLAGYMLFFTLLVGYQLHEPLSYLTKKWFWTQPQSTTALNQVLTAIPEHASIVTQVNIVPHLSHRTQIFPIWPEQKTFLTQSPCGVATCWWVRMQGHPTYFLVDTDPAFDIRHFLADRPVFLSLVQNLQNAGVIQLKEKKGNVALYTIVSKKWL